MKRALLATPGFEALCRYLSRGHVRVLMYHRFSAGEGDSQRLGARHFARQLAYIARHHQVWSPDQQLQERLESTNADGCPVVVTIDDGYADFAQIAKPLLDKFAVSATLFVVTDFVAGKLWFWWDKLRFALQAAATDTYVLSAGDKQYHLTLDDEIQRGVAWSQIASDLSVLTPAEIQDYLAAIAVQLAVEIPTLAPAEYAAVSWADLRQAARDNIVLGAHTQSHPALSRVSASEAASEIGASRAQILAETGNCSGVFCYPHGQQEDYSEATIAVVQELGFSGAYVAYESNGAPEGEFEMTRYSVHDDWIDFRWKLCGAQYLLQRS